jgi:hypothetical protein
MALLAQSFNKALIVADYLANTARYAQNCVNKAKPQKRCHGKCQMIKRLAAEEKKEGQNPERKPGGRPEPVLFHKPFADPADISNTLATLPGPNAKPVNTTLRKQHRDIFHPPKG